MIASLLTNEYVSAFGYIVGVVSGCIAIYQTMQVTKKNNEIQQLNVTINDLNSQITNITTNRNNINQGSAPNISKIIMGLLILIIGGRYGLWC